MTRGHRVAVAAASALFLLGALFQFCAPPRAEAQVRQPESSTKPCGSLRINYSPLPGEHYSRMYVRAPLSVACGKARSLLRRYQHHHSGCDDSGCTLSYPDGWTCHAPSPGDWPWIMACERDGAKVDAYVKSKIKGPR
jgi:hypothetical protein